MSQRNLTKYKFQRDRSRNSFEFSNGLEFSQIPGGHSIKINKKGWDRNSKPNEKLRLIKPCHFYNLHFPNSKTDISSTIYTITKFITPNTTHIFPILITPHILVTSHPHQLIKKNHNQDGDYKNNHNHHLTLQSNPCITKAPKMAHHSLPHHNSLFIILCPTIGNPMYTREWDVTCRVE